MFTVFDRVKVKLEGAEVCGIIIGIDSDNSGAEYEVLLDEGGIAYYRDDAWMRALPTITAGQTVSYEGRRFTTNRIYYNPTIASVRAEISDGRIIKCVPIEDLKNIATADPVVGNIVINVVNEVINHAAKRMVAEVVAMCPGGLLRKLTRVQLKGTGKVGTITDIDEKHRIYTIMLDEGGKVQKKQSWIDQVLDERFDLGDKVSTPDGPGRVYSFSIVRIGSKQYFLYTVLLTTGRAELYSPLNLEVIKAKEKPDLEILDRAHRASKVGKVTVVFEGE